MRLMVSLMVIQVIDADETHGEETQRVIWISCIDDWRCTCLTIGVRETREFDPMIWLRLMCEETRHANLDARNHVQS